MLTAGVTIREASSAEIPEILRQRQRLYQDVGCEDADAVAAMASASESYLRRALVEGSFHEWLAFWGERVAGGGGIIVSPWLAHPYDLGCRRATILNVYVYPEFRRRGVATDLMKTMIAWCRDEGFAAVDLHASKEGRPLYERLGFERDNDMKFTLR